MKRRRNYFAHSAPAEVARTLIQGGGAWWKTYGFRNLKEVARLWEDYAGWVLDPKKGQLFDPWRSRWIRVPKDLGFRDGGSRPYRLGNRDMARIEAALYNGQPRLYFDEVFRATPYRRAVQQEIEKAAAAGKLGKTWPRPAAIGLRSRTRKRIAHGLARRKRPMAKTRPTRRRRVRARPAGRTAALPARARKNKKNPELIVLENPRGSRKKKGLSRRQRQENRASWGNRRLYEAALKKYRSLHGTTPMKLEQIRVPAGTPKYLIMLGRAHKIQYIPSRRSELHDRGSSQTVYTHKFGSGVRVATDPQGKYLVVADTKGKMRVSLAGRKVGIIG